MLGFLSFLLRALLALFALRLLFALGRHLSRSVRRTRPAGTRPGRGPAIDRSTVIDVPFTEENRHAMNDAPPDNSASEPRPGAR